MGRPTTSDNPEYARLKERVDALKKQKQISDFLHKKRVLEAVRDAIYAGLSDYGVGRATGVTQHKYLRKLIEEATKGEQNG